MPRGDDGAAMPAARTLPLRLERVGYSAGGARLIDGLDLCIEPWRRTVIIGPNGAGKSLLLRLCHGLLEPTAGSIRRGAAGTGAAAARRHQALVFQQPVLLRRSVIGNLRHALAARAVRGAERRRRVDAALALAGLEAIARRPARVLSAGEQQRLALVRAWALAPEVLFLDEPTASLDPSATRAVEELILRFHAEGIAIVLVTHDLGQARRLGQTAVMLHRGRVVEHGPAARLLEQPREPLTRAYLAGELLW